MNSAGVRAGKACWDASSREWNRFMREREEQVFLVLALLIGALVGMVVVAFHSLDGAIRGQALSRGWVGMAKAARFRSWVRHHGLFALSLFPDARGSGVPQTKAAPYARGGRISLGTVFAPAGPEAQLAFSSSMVSRRPPCGGCFFAALRILSTWEKSALLH